ncbi:hypothetical protein ABK040_012602 [Willaertia magna]
MVRSDLKVKWKLRNNKQVIERSGHSCATIPNTPLMYVFGGAFNHTGDHISAKQLDVYNAETNTWKRAGLVIEDNEIEDAKILRPKARVGASLIGIEKGQQIGELSYAATSLGLYETQEAHSALILFGGWSEVNVLNDLWKFNCKTEKWINLTDKQKGQVPTPRSNHSAVIIDNSLILFGGLGEEMEDVKQDMYILNLQTLQWRKIQLDDTDDKPPASRSHACCVHRKSMILFGGGTEKVCYNTLYRFDLEVERWFKIKPRKSEELLEAEKDPTKPIASNLILVEPEPRMFCEAILYDMDRLFLFGGRNGKQKINEVWQFDFQNSQWNLMQVGDYLEDDTNASGNSLVLNDDDMNTIDDFEVPEVSTPTPTSATVNQDPFGHHNNANNNNNNNGLDNDVMMRDNKKRRALKPSPRSGSKMVVVTTGKPMGPKFNRILIFGGNDSKGKLSEVWELVVDQRTYTKHLQRLLESNMFSDLMIQTN